MTGKPPAVARAVLILVSVVGLIAAAGWLAFQPRARDDRAPAAAPSSACDARLRFTPEAPVAGSALSVVYAHGQPLKYVDLKVTGPVFPGVRLDDLALEDRANWSWSVSALEPGTYRFDVWGGKPSVLVASCTKRVVPARSE